mgnify:CR=1 FL=1
MSGFCTTHTFATFQSEHSDPLIFQWYDGAKFVSHIKLWKNGNVTTFKKQNT